MAQYINKDALVAEIERLCKEHSSKYERDEAALVLEDLEDFLDTLEVKEVNFDEEFSKYHIGIYNPFNSGADIYEFAKHFFELGLKAQKGE